VHVSGGLPPCIRTRACRGGFRRGGAASEENCEQAQERQCNQVLIHCEKETNLEVLPDVLMSVPNPAGKARRHEALLMKTQYFTVILTLGSLAFAGCATETASTTQTKTDQTTTRVHTQEELRKTGESQTGPALEKTDAAIRTEGNR